MYHTFSPPYRPPSNGLAERAVQTVKDEFLKQKLHDSAHKMSRSLSYPIGYFLYSYWNTPHSTTGVKPSETFLNFKPRIHLSLLKLHLANDMNLKQVQIVKTANN